MNFIKSIFIAVAVRFTVSANAQTFSWGAPVLSHGPSIALLEY